MAGKMVGLPADSSFKRVCWIRLHTSFILGGFGGFFIDGSGLYSMGKLEAHEFAAWTSRFSGNSTYYFFSGLRRRLLVIPGYCCNLRVVVPNKAKFI